MASRGEVNRLRRLTNYFDTEPHDDTALSGMLDESTLYAVASDLWAEKAAGLAHLVNTSESGSSRSLGSAYENALKMSNHYASLDKADQVETDTVRVARTRAIVREATA